MALDDPEGWDVYRQIQEVARDDPDVRLFTNLTGVGNVEVNALQRCSDVVWLSRRHRRRMRATRR